MAEVPRTKAASARLRIGQKVMFCLNQDSRYLKGWQVFPICSAAVNLATLHQGHTLPVPYRNPRNATGSVHSAAY